MNFFIYSHFRYENTFKLEPDKSFPYAATKNTIENVLAERLGPEKYDANKVAEWSKDLSEILRDRAKLLIKGRRYKVVSYVVIGEKDLGAVALASRCLWNDKYDTRAEAVFTNGSLYAIGVVYGLYFE